MLMTDRQRQILFAIIEEYAELATPVGSVTLAKLFDVSSATIRAEMVKLEEMGYIMQPHTSAGRVPTDAGYRLYVNQLQDKLEQAPDIKTERGRICGELMDAIIVRFVHSKLACNHKHARIMRFVVLSIAL